MKHSLTPHFFARSALASSIALFCSSAALADTPPGWMSTDHLNAYTLDAMTLDLSLGALAVNDDIDFLDIREDLLAGTRRLEGDSGDLSGNQAELQFGLTSYLTLFYRRQETDLTIEIGDVKSANLISLDDRLTTESSAYGFKWNFYESGHFDNSRAWRAASLEVARTESSSDDFAGTLDRITLSDDLVVNFTSPRTFRMQDMEDEGWQARILYSTPLSDTFTVSLWGGYAENEATSGTGSDIQSAFIAPAFEQSFEAEQQQVMAGLGFNWQITPRLPLQLSYEYIHINSQDTEVRVNPSNVLLPGFLRANNLGSSDTDDNHTLTGRVSYWITPQLNVSLSAKVFSNQFLGITPHYNNPLTASFADKPYGYAGLSVGFRI